MTLYVVGIVVFIIVIIGCVIAISYLSGKEKEYMEVSDQYLKRIGKDYTKDIFANWACNTYIEVINAVLSEDYNYLRDVLSDDLYNNYLLSIKNAKDRKVQNYIENIRPEFSKLVNLKLQGSLEVAKVWMKIHYIEYTKDVSPLPEGEEAIGERIISGSKTNMQSKEYMLTFVKEHTDKESAVCPNCGFVYNIIDRCKCVRCGANISHKQYHWVMIGKEEMRHR